MAWSRQHAITLDIVDPALCCHTASLGPSKFKMALPFSLLLSNQSTERLKYTIMTEGLYLLEKQPASNEIIT